jgi:hypothetical protein
MVKPDISRKMKRKKVPKLSTITIPEKYVPLSPIKLTVQTDAVNTPASARRPSADLFGLETNGSAIKMSMPMTDRTRSGRMCCTSKMKVSDIARLIPASR